MAFLYFLIVIVPIIAIHEYGHYWAGKKAGIPAEVFSIGFGPVIFSRTDKAGTRWQIAAIPFGGYVKFRNDANDTAFPSIDPEKPPYRASYAGKMLTIFAGPLANFILSTLIFAVLAMVIGISSERPTVGEISIEAAQSLRAGDEVRTIDGRVVSNFNDIYAEAPALAAGQAALVPMEITRNGSALSGAYLSPYAPVVGQVMAGSAADLAGVQSRDLILDYDGVRVPDMASLSELIAQREDARVTMTVLRAGEEVALSIAPVGRLETGADGEQNFVYRIGVTNGALYVPAQTRLNPVSAVGHGVGRTYEVIALSLTAIGDLITREIGIETLSGPIGIARIADQAAGFGLASFATLLALVSASIGFLNLLPLPILDGGHLILLTYEKLTGRLPAARVLNAIFALGFALLLGLFIMTSINDIMR